MISTRKMKHSKKFSINFQKRKESQVKQSMNQKMKEKEAGCILIIFKALKNKLGQ